MPLRLDLRAPPRETNREPTGTPNRHHPMRPVTRASPSTGVRPVGISQDRLIAIIRASRALLTSYNATVECIRTYRDTPTPEHLAAVYDALTLFAPPPHVLITLASETAHFSPSRVHRNHRDAAKRRIREGRAKPGDREFAHGARTRTADTEEWSFVESAPEPAHDAIDTFAQSMRKAPDADMHPDTPETRAFYQRLADEALLGEDDGILSPPVPPELQATAPFAPNIVEHIDVPPPCAKPSK